MKQELYLNSFHSVSPPHRIPQEDLLKWVMKAHLKSCQLRGDSKEAERLERVLPRFSVGAKYIGHRYFECDDLDDNWPNHGIYHFSETTPFGASIADRNRFFSLKAQKIVKELYQDHDPNHVIHVTCTGYISPDPIQSFFSTKARSPEITHAYHMGCYASLPAIRMAMGLCSLSEAEVDILNTEMCGLHMNPSIHTPEQIVVQTLFADGHIKYCVGHKRGGFRILSIKEKLIPDTQTEMSWIPDAFGMQMTLSREVPRSIRSKVRDFIRELCDQSRMSEEEVLKEAVFAIHPGGPRIIEGIEEELNLTEDQVKHGKEILFERGNMSSSTLPHIWERIQSKNYPRGTKIVSLAFGPGLTIFGAIFMVEG